MIERIWNPLDWNALKAVSLPDPGPFNLTTKVFKPCSWALPAAWSAAICAAYGVDFLEPLKPFEPAEDQAITFPWSSVIVTIVLLNVALTKAIPVETFFLIFFLTFFGLITLSALSFLSSVLLILFFFSIFLII